MPIVHTPNDLQPCTRAGFSIVEVLIALVIVAVGLLGIAGASALSVRAANAALREHSATGVALARLAALSAVGCPAAGSGSSGSAPGPVERWTVSAPAPGVRMLYARVEWFDGAARRAVGLQSAVFC